MTDYFGECNFIESYKDALAYYSLNQLFLDHLEEELENFLEELYS